MATIIGAINACKAPTWGWDFNKIVYGQATADFLLREYRNLMDEGQSVVVIPEGFSSCSLPKAEGLIVADPRDISFRVYTDRFLGIDLDQPISSLESAKVKKFAVDYAPQIVLYEEGLRKREEAYQKWGLPSPELQSMHERHHFHTFALLDYPLEVISSLLDNIRYEGILYKTGSIMSELAKGRAIGEFGLPERIVRMIDLKFKLGVLSEVFAVAQDCLVLEAMGHDHESYLGGFLAEEKVLISLTRGLLESPGSIVDKIQHWRDYIQGGDLMEEVEANLLTVEPKKVSLTELLASQREKTKAEEKKRGIAMQPSATTALPLEGKTQGLAGFLRMYQQRPEILASFRQGPEISPQISNLIEVLLPELEIQNQGCSSGLLIYEENLGISFRIVSEDPDCLGTKNSIRVYFSNVDLTLIFSWKKNGLNMTLEAKDKDRLGRLLLTLAAPGGMNSQFERAATLINLLLVGAAVNGTTFEVPLKLMLDVFLQNRDFASVTAGELENKIQELLGGEKGFAFDKETVESSRNCKLLSLAFSLLYFFSAAARDWERFKEGVEEKIRQIEEKIKQEKRETPFPGEAQEINTLKYLLGVLKNLYARPLPS